MENYQLDLAREFVLHTRQNIFLTGRAGTGKTTFLQNVLKETDKNYIVVAPTGVAAINAGGVTIHSMFHFPLTAFVPTNDRVDYEVATTRYGLSKHIRYRADKAKLLRQLDLLIIDEISMVRSDLLDAIDYALQRVRRSNLPFGNVQLLVIGDLFQLAPVVKPRVWSALRIYYDSPFFFDALAWKESKPVTIELTKIYRQKNQDFIDILNRMRKGKTIAADIESLNAKYDPAFDAVGKQYITLSTHNRKVDAINEKQMNALNTPVFVFDALIEGQFSEHAYPADFSLRLKKGAQVMFIRNDAEGRYFNGKLAEIIEINEDHIEAQLQDGEALTVERLEWPNKKYVLNEESGEIEEKEVGKFSQYPLRLAWAITVHKSQGLTFERMAVDLGDTFAPGQAYVALSRCRSLEGMVLLSQMKINSVSVSPQIVRYHQRSGQGTALETMLEKAKLRFATEQLILAFDFSEIELTCTQWLDAIKEKELPEKANVLRLALQVRDYCKEQRRHGRNFQRELRQMLAGDRNQAMSLLKNRTSKAVDYFTNGLYSHGIMPIQLHIKAFIFKSGVSKYLEVAQEAEDALWSSIQKMYRVALDGENLYNGPIKFVKPKASKKPKKAAKRKKGDSASVTFQLYQEGKGIDEIAQVRSLKRGTIESHVTSLIKDGKINIYDLMPKEEVDEVTKKWQKVADLSTSEFKNAHGTDQSYGQLRMIKAWMDLMASEG